MARSSQLVPGSVLGKEAQLRGERTSSAARSAQIGLTAKKAGQPAALDAALSRALLWRIGSFGERLMSDQSMLMVLHRAGKGQGAEDSAACVPSTRPKPSMVGPQRKTIWNPEVAKIETEMVFMFVAVYLNCACNLFY